MDLTLPKKFNTARSVLFLLLLILAFWCVRSIFETVSAHMVFSVTSFETVEQIIDHIKEENSGSPEGNGKNQPSLKEEIEHAKGRLPKSEYKAAKSNYKRMLEHIDKLEKYKHDPLNHDHLGLLKNAPNDQVRQKIIQSRISHFEKEIQTFYNNIVKIIS